MILKGYIAFLDPPKDSAGKAIDALQNHGVTVKVLTGDNDLVTRKVCREVGLDTSEILLGSKVETMTDDKGLRAMDESASMRNWCSAKLGISETEDARRDYQKLIATPLPISESGSVARYFNDEATWQRREGSTLFVKSLKVADVIPNINVTAARMRCGLTRVFGKNRDNNQSNPSPTEN